MTDVPATRPAALLDPVTGELLELERPAELAAFRDRLGDLKRMIDSTLSDVDELITARLDLENTRSGRYGDWDVVTEAPLETVWDVPRLGVALEALVQAGRITRNAAGAALEPVTTYKPRAKELAKLLAHADAEVIAAVDACRHAEPRSRRRVTVKRAGPAQRRLRGAQGPAGGQA